MRSAEEWRNPSSPPRQQRGASHRAGQGPARIPTSGKIRAGTKTLSRAAAENPQARAVYEQGVAAGQSFDQIEQALATALPAPEDTAGAEERALVHRAPAGLLEPGDRAADPSCLRRRPRRWPSALSLSGGVPVGPLAGGDATRTGGLGRERRAGYWSEYPPDGRVRHCKTHAPVPFDDTGKRVIRVFGGRKTVARDANGGICDPEGCPEYQQRQCNLSGRFLFFIPGGSARSSCTRAASTR